MDAVDAGIHARSSPYLERFVQIGVASGRVVQVSFPETPDETADTESEHAVLEAIFEYLDGVRAVTFDDVSIALTVPTAHRRVLEQTRTIPYGEQVDVRQLGRMAGLDPDDDADVTSVRTALDENPTPLLIPDHRVRDGPSAAPPAVEQKLRSLEEL